MLKLFLYLHVIGIVVLIGGVVAYLYPVSGLQTTGAMVAVASAIGLGLLMISPYPVVKAMQWMMKETASSRNETWCNIRAKALLTRPV